MKKENYTTNKNLIATLSLAIIILLSGCKKETSLQPIDENLSSKTNSSTFSIDPNVSYTAEKVATLVVGEQQTKIGKIVIKNHTSGLMEVTYMVDAPWKLSSVRLFIGAKADIPLTSGGTADPNAFPFKQNLPAFGQTYSTFLIQRDVVKGCRSVAAQAQVFNSVTGTPNEICWAKGSKITQTGDWGMYYSYCMDDFRPDVNHD
jgi:hypothetical protein